MEFQLKANILKKCYRTIDKLPLVNVATTHLSPDFLQENNITLSDLDWHPEDTIDTEPQFCDPLPVEIFEPLFREPLARQDKHDREWQKPFVSLGYVRRRLFAAAGSPADWLAYTGVHRYTTRSSKTYGGPSNWHTVWLMLSVPWPQRKLEPGARNKDGWPVLTAEDLGKPNMKSRSHMATVLTDHDSPVCEQKILRSELIAAVVLMREGMRIPDNMEEHAIFPVFVYSWSGSHVRVLQVHFDYDTDRLMVRKTSYIQIDGPEKQDELKLMIRWMSNVPKGNTRWEDLDTEKLLAWVDSSSANQPASSAAKQSVQSS